MKKLIASLSLVLVVALGVVGLSACKTSKNSYVGSWAMIKTQMFDASGKCVATQDMSTNRIPLFRLNKDGTIDVYAEIEEVWIENFGNWKYKNGKVTLTFKSGIVYKGKITKGNLVLTSKIDDEGKGTSTLKKV